MRRVHARIVVLVATVGAVFWSVEAAAQEKSADVTKRRQIYDEKADAKALVVSALKRAGRDQTNVLVMLGGNWCGWCHKLHDVFESQKEIRSLVRDEYELVMLDTQAPGTEELMKSWQVETDKGVPYLVILDSSGGLVTRQETGSLEEGDRHDPEKVKAFLTRHRAAPIAASEVLKAGVAKAASEGKRVLLHFGAPWCGWCHRLDDFLARPEIARIVEKDYVEVKIDTDRMPGGDEVLANYRQGKDGGIPWMVILDAAGNALVTSDGERGNVGYPVEAGEIAHFLTMLRKTAKRISEEEIAGVGRALERTAEEIKGSARGAVLTGAAEKDA